MLSVSRCYISRFKGQWFCLKVRLTPHLLAKPLPFKTRYIASRGVPVNCETKHETKYTETKRNETKRKEMDVLEVTAPNIL